MFSEDTIAAITTPPGIGGVGIIRVSGKDALLTVNTIFKSPKATPLMERNTMTVNYGYIVDEEKKLDEVLLLIMRGPHSYTAEDVVEIQCHGGFVSVQQILKLLLTKNVRLAEPGEFTKRAFLNGRIDLTQAEAVIDIIEAKTEESLSVAVNQLDGTLSSMIRELREVLITLIAHMEVTIDYPEEDIEDITTIEARDKIQAILIQMETLLSTAQSGRLIREGISAAIVGRPNAGKSSLLNALLRENRAIVTDIPGTTRDSIEEYMNIEGIPLRLIDTAGIRETEDIIEKIGVDKARDYVEKSDLIFCVIDASSPLTQEEIDILLTVPADKTLVLLNKSDQGTVINVADVKKYGDFKAVESISASKSEGLEVLVSYVKEMVYGGFAKMSHHAVLSNVRHISLMRRAHTQLTQAIHTIDSGMLIDCAVTDIREAWELLGEITGDSVGESLIDALFSRFCLGK